MCLVMESTNKDQHIQKIMEMGESSQECFVSIIKNALDPRLFSESKKERDIIYLLKRVIH